MRKPFLGFLMLGAIAALFVGGPLGAQEEANPDPTFRFADSKEVVEAFDSGRAREYATSTGLVRLVDIEARSFFTSLPQSGSVRFALGNGVAVDVNVEQSVSPLDGGVAFWSGRSDNGFASFTRVDGQLEGLFVDADGNRSFVLLPVAPNTYLLAEETFDRPTELEPPEAPDVAEPIALTTDGEVVDVPAPRVTVPVAPPVARAAASPVVDVLVWYDALALAHYGDAATAELAFNSSVNNTNSAAASSGAMVEFNIVAIEQTSWTPPASPLAALNQISNKYDGVLDDIHAARDSVAADLVVFVTDVPGHCGIAQLPSQQPSPATDGQSFSYNDADCLGANLTIPHEIAHTFGAGHDVTASQPGPGLYTYSQGYINPSQNYMTIMSYQTACSFCTRIPYFSNPTETYNGSPTGDAGKDNARTLTEGAAAIAAYRPQACPPPAGDDFAGRVQLGSTFQATSQGTTDCATLGSEAYYTNTVPVESVWHEWTAPATGTATISTCSAVTDFDTWLTIYEGDSFGIIPGAFSNDDFGCAEGTSNSTVVLAVTSGTTYFISLDSPGQATGAYELQVSMPGAPELTILDEPCVVYNSTNPMNGGDVDTVQVTGALTGQNGDPSCVPAGATAGVFTISSVDPLTEGNLRMTPTGVAASGNAGVVNYGANNGFNNANTVTIPLSASGAVDIAANAGPGDTNPTTDVQLMVIGYYTPTAATSLKYFPITPCAAADTRPSQGANGTYDGPNNDSLWPVGNNFPDIDVVGTIPAGQGGGNSTGCGVPATADAVVVNLVAVNAEGASGFLSVAPGGQSPAANVATPFALLNPKMNNSATTIINLNGGETIAIDIDGGAGAKTAIRAVVVGYYDDDPAGLDFTTVNPCAVFDSRANGATPASGNFAGLRQDGIANATTYTVTGNQIPTAQGGIIDTGTGNGTCEVPPGASAVLINLVAVNAETEGNFRAYTPAAPTTGGVLNFASLTPKMNNSNTVTVPIDASGQLTLEVNAGPQTPDDTPVTHARGIILGYYN